MKNKMVLQNIIKGGLIAKEVYSTIKLVIVGILFTSILFFAKAPLLLALGVGFVFLIFLFLAIIRIKRLSSVNLSGQLEAVNKKQRDPSFYRDEVILSVVYGVLREASKGSLVRGYALLGVGKVKSPENAIIVTNKRIIFIVVPIFGGNNLLDGVDFNMYNFMLNPKKLKEKGQELIASTTPDQIVNLDKNNFDLDINDINEIKAKTKFRQYILFKTNKENYKYSIRNKEDLVNLEITFKKNFPEKIK